MCVCVCLCVCVCTRTRAHALTRGKVLDAVQKMIQCGPVLLHKSQFLQFPGGEGAQPLASEATKVLKIEGGELELLRCPLHPLVHLVLCPLSGVWGGKRGSVREVSSLQESLE